LADGRKLAKRITATMWLEAMLRIEERRPTKYGEFPRGQLRIENKAHGNSLLMMVDKTAVSSRKEVEGPNRTAEEMADG
jgi:hypothetical protein